MHREDPNGRRLIYLAGWKVIVGKLFYVISPANKTDSFKQHFFLRSTTADCVLANSRPLASGQKYGKRAAWLGKWRLRLK